MESLPVDVLIQGGAVGLALALIVLMYFERKQTTKERKQFYDIIRDHMTKTDSTIEKNATTMTRLAGVITANTTSTDRNSEIMSRVEKTLDRR